jgi:hypothetical protein
MEDLELFFGLLIVVGVLAGVVVFARSSRRGFPGEPLSTAGRKGTTPFHRGINSTSTVGEDLENLPGVLITIAFVFIFLGIFCPATTSGFWSSLLPLKSWRLLSTSF